MWWPLPTYRTFVSRRCFASSVAQSADAMRRLGLFPARLKAVPRFSFKIQGRSQRLPISILAPARAAWAVSFGFCPGFRGKRVRSSLASRSAMKSSASKRARFAAPDIPPLRATSAHTPERNGHRVPLLRNHDRIHGIRHRAVAKDVKFRPGRLFRQQRRTRFPVSVVQKYVPAGYLPL